MGFMRYDRRTGYLVDPHDKPVYVVGVNYVASYVCTNFWDDWRPEVINQDLKRISKLGLTAVRVPMVWGFLEPEEGKYNPVIFERFDVFLGFCKEYGLYIMPWFLVGVATRNYDVPFRNGRPFFEGHMVDVAENHLKNFIGHYRNEEQILFWDICDEPEFYDVHYGAAKVPYDRRVMARWVRTMYEAIKSVDRNHLVTLGFGHIASENYGMHIRDMAEILDVMVVTGYPYGLAIEGIDLMRNNYFIPFCVRFHRLGKPVFTCEAPGFSSVLYSEAMLGRYFRVVLYSNLINGSTGVMPWAFNDFAPSIWHECPLDEATFEPYFGIVAVDGRLKPSGKELSEFAEFVAGNHLTRFSFGRAEVAILVPRGYYPEINSAFRRIYTSFILAKGCSADVDFVWDDRELDGYKLVIISSTRQMTTPVWDKIRRYVQEGGMVYHIFDSQSGLSAYFNDLFGVEVQTVERNFGHKSFRLKCNWGRHLAGEAVELVGQGIDEYVKVEARQAEVVAEFEDRTPAVLRNRYGKGIAYLVTLPVESGFIEIEYRDFLRNGLFELYDLLMEEAKVTRLVKSGDHRIEVGVLQDRKTRESMVICINHDASAVTTRLYFHRKLAGNDEGMKVYDLDSGEYLETREDDNGMKYVDSCFGPAGVNVYRI